MSPLQDYYYSGEAEFEQLSFRARFAQFPTLRPEDKDWSTWIATTISVISQLRRHTWAFSNAWGDIFVVTGTRIIEEREHFATSLRALRRLAMIDSVAITCRPDKAI